MKEIETPEEMAGRLYPTRRPETAIASAAARAMVADAVEQRDAQIVAALEAYAKAEDVEAAVYARADDVALAARARGGAASLRSFARKLGGAP